MSDDHTTVTNSMVQSEGEPDGHEIQPLMTPIRTHYYRSEAPHRLANADILEKDSIPQISQADNDGSDNEITLLKRINNRPTNSSSDKYPIVSFSQGPSTRNCTKAETAKCRKSMQNQNLRSTMEKLPQPMKSYLTSFIVTVSVNMGILGRRRKW